MKRQRLFLFGEWKKALPCAVVPQAAGENILKGCPSSDQLMLLKDHRSLAPVTPDSVGIAQPADSPDNHGPFDGADQKVQTPQQR